MKKLMTYVAVDTDNVGESIGNAVLSNDVNSLSSISENINSGVKVFSQWAEYNGGEVISSGSDEAIFKVPQSSIKDLEELKNTYTKQTGFTISIGIGENVSDAAKALIYAKMNGKDQIMDYSPEMERAMKESLTGDVQRLEGGVGDETEPEDLPQDELEEGTEHELEHTDDEEIAEEIAIDHLEESDDYYSDLEEMEEKDAAEEAGQETEEIEVPAEEVDGDYGSEKMAEGQPEHELDMEEDEEFIHDAQENREDEADEDIIEADEEESEEEAMEDVEEEAMEDVAESDTPSEEDIDLDGQPDLEEEHGEITPDEDLDGDGDVEHEEAMAAESSETEEYDDTGDFADEVQEDKELSSAIEEEMSEPEEVMDEAMAIEEEMEGDDFSNVEGEENLDHEAIKDVIFESLQNFKQNRDYLESIAQENPELYQSLIFTLQAMIEMAKEFGYGEIEEDMAGADEEAMMVEGEGEKELNPDDFAVMEEEGEGEEELNPDDFAVEEEEEEDIEKNENFLRLMYKMHRISEMFNELKKADEEKSIEEMKEETKKKLKDKTKGKSSKKRKISIKKPIVPGKKEKKKPKKTSNDGSFCARSHQKMRASGKDCRSNEDKHSPLCSARKKFNCRGKNEEKNKKMDKSEILQKAKDYQEPKQRQKQRIRKNDKIENSEKLSKFLKKKDKKLEKRGLPKERTGTYKGKEHVSKPHHIEFTVKGNKMKVINNQNGETEWRNMSNGIQGKDQFGDPEPAPGPGNKPAPMVKPSKV